MYGVSFSATSLASDDVMQGFRCNVTPLPGITFYDLCPRTIA